MAVSVSSLDVENAERGKALAEDQGSTSPNRCKCWIVAGCIMIAVLMGVVALMSASRSTGVPAALLGPQETRHFLKNATVTLIGSGNWGTAVAKIVAENARRSAYFNPNVRMYVFEEIMQDFEGKEYKLTEYINKYHENAKYLGGVALPDNLFAEPDLLESVRDSDVLVWGAPHQFVLKQIEMVKGIIKPNAVSVSLIKGGFEIVGKTPKLMSEQLKEVLGTSRGDVSVLMGANLAGEVAAGKFAEATLGCRGGTASGQVSCQQLQKLFNSPNFRVDHVPDIEAVEVCGSLKNVVALAAGFSDGVSMGNNAKAAIVRHGLMEMQAFIRHFYPRSSPGTFFESAGLADLVTTCYGGRNRLCAEAFARSRVEGVPKSWDDIATELLKGQKLQGTLTAEELIPIIRANDLEKLMPLHVAVHGIAFEGKPIQTLFDAIALN